MDFRDRKVQREVKFRGSMSSDRQFDFQQEKEWTATVRQFFATGGPETASQAKKRLRFTARAQPRLATLHWLEDMSNAMQSVGAMWHHFAGQDELLKNPAPAIKPKFVMVCTDQEATQPGGLSYLKWEKGVWVEHVWDPEHRRANDVTLGLSEAGLYQRACFCVALFNIKYGPFQKAGFFRLMKEVATQISREMGPNDAVLQFFFQDILHDLGEPPQHNTEARRAAFLETLPVQPWVCAKGPKASLSRFNSWSAAFDFIDQFWSSQAFLLVCASLMNGWSRYADEFWAPNGKLMLQDEAQTTAGSASSSSSQPPAKSHMPTNTPHEGAAAQGAPGPAGADADPPSGHTSKASAKAKAKQQMQDLRNKSVNSLHACARSLCDPECRTECRIIGYLMRSEAKASGAMLRDLRGAGSTRTYYSEWAHWRWLQELKEMLATLTELPTLERIGFTVQGLQSKGRNCGVGSPELAWEDHLACLLFKAARCILKQRVGSSIGYVWGAPCCTAGLLHKDPKFAEKSLLMLQAADKAMLEADAIGTPLTIELLRGQGLTTPLMRWLRQALRETSFTEVPALVKQVLDEMWGGLLNSKLVEDWNKDSATKHSRHPNRKRAPR